MTTLEAYHITRKFKTSFKDATPALYININLHKQTTVQNKNVKYFIKIFENDNVFFSKRTSKEVYESFKIKEDASANEVYHHKIKNIERPYYFTSIGLVDEETFFLAEDIMENLTFIKKKELEIDSVYKSIQGKEYLFIGEISINNDFADSDIYSYQLLSLNDKRFLNLASIKLIEYVREQKKDVLLIRTDISSESKKLVFK